MTGSPPWGEDWFGTAAHAGRELWRGVEAQHRVATMRLVDSLQDLELLEQLLESSKPPLPRESRGLHYLLATPFRYTAPWPSRFRWPHEPGAWYGADEPRTVAAELAYWRWRFLLDSDGLVQEQLVTEYTFLQARFAGQELDLTMPPWASRRHLWRDPQDYTACHRLAHRVRGDARLSIAALRYESARREFAACEVVFSAVNLTLAAPNAQQTWVCKTTRDLVLFTREREALEFRP